MNPIALKIKSWSERTDESDLKADVYSAIASFLIEPGFSSNDLKEIRLALTELPLFGDEPESYYWCLRDLLRNMEAYLSSKEKCLKVDQLIQNDLVLSLLKLLSDITPLPINEIEGALASNTSELIHSTLSAMQDVGMVSEYTDGWILTHFGCSKSLNI
jgi:hypothetical protein